MKAAEKNQYQWQGEPVKVEFGTCVVEENKDKPMWWYNFECNLTHPKGIAVIEAVRVIHETGSFILANHCGIAVHKLLNGGWPNYAHFSLDGDFKASKSPVYKITEFDLFGYELHEAGRRKWQRENFPAEFERSEALRRVFQK